MGRKSQFDQDTVCRAIINSRGSLTKAAKQLGVSRTAVANWVEADPRCREVFDTVNEILVDRVEQELLDLCLEKKDLRAIMFFLAARGKKRGYEKGTADQDSGQLKSLMQEMRIQQLQIEKQHLLLADQALDADASPS